jgi:hypothetical protein
MDTRTFQLIVSNTFINMLSLCQLRKRSICSIYQLKDPLFLRRFAWCGKTQSEKDFSLLHFCVLCSHLLQTISLSYFPPSFSLLVSLTCLVTSVLSRRTSVFACSVYFLFSFYVLPDFNILGQGFLTCVRVARNRFLLCEHQYAICFVEISIQRVL